MALEDAFVFLPLGGAGEIGINLGLYGVGPAEERAWLAVDFGIGFTRDLVPGVEVVLPDIRFLESEKHNLQGIVLTHAHEDHYGALPQLWERLRVPVYATPFTAAMLEAKLADTPHAPRIEICEVSQTSRWQLGPFDLELIPMSHSIPEANALAIRTKYGMALHTGDWKLDQSPVVGKAMDEERLKHLADEGILALICDSTNALREGVSPSEAEIADELGDLIRSAKNRVVVTAFASNVARLYTIAKVSQEAGRDVVLAGRSMQRVAAIADELGYFKGLAPFVSLERYKTLPRNKVVVVCTGSQGEERAALARISWGRHPAVKLASGDRVIFSSRTIPGNESAVNGIINRLIDQNIEIKTDRDALVHVSGHPRRGELAQMYALARPRILVPVHGEPQHLAAHAAFARQNGVKHVLELRNGQMACLGPQEPAIVDEVPAGRLYRTGNLVRDYETSGIEARYKLSFAGVVCISLVLSPGGELAAEPLVYLCGLPEFDEEETGFEDLVLDAVDDALEAMQASRRRSPQQVEASVRRFVRAAVYEIWGKKPVCHVMAHMS